MDRILTRQDMIDWQGNKNAYAKWQEAQSTNLETPKATSYTDRLATTHAKEYFYTLLKGYDYDLIGRIHPSKEEIEEEGARIIFFETRPNDPIRSNLEKFYSRFFTVFCLEWDAHLPKNYRNANFPTQALVKSVEYRENIKQGEITMKEQHAKNLVSLSTIDNALMDATRVALKDYSSNFALVREGLIRVIKVNLTRNKITSTFDIIQYSQTFYNHYKNIHTLLRDEKFEEVNQLVKTLIGKTL